MDDGHIVTTITSAALLSLPTLVLSAVMPSTIFATPDI